MWCYTTDPKKEWDKCDPITSEKNEEAYVVYPGLEEKLDEAVTFLNDHDEKVCSIVNTFHEDRILMK